MKRTEFDRLFPNQSEPTPAPISDVLAEICEGSTFSPLLVDIFREEADNNTWTTIGRRDRTERFAIGGKIKKLDTGYIRLRGGLDNAVRLTVSSWRKWGEFTTEEFRDSLLETDFYKSHHDLVTLTADADGLGGMANPIKGMEAVLLVDQLQMEMATGRTRLAPSGPMPVYYYVHTEFIPRILREKITHVAGNVPLTELQRWSGQ